MTWGGSQWRFLTATVESDHFEIGGLAPWQHEWRPVKDARAAVRAPQYGQHFTFDVYEIGPAARPVRFAAGEFSNGIWGFYVPA